MTPTVQISENNIYSIFKQHKFGYLGGRDFAISDDGLNWSVINHYTDLLLNNPSIALIGDYYYIISDDSFYKTKDFNTFIKLDAQITDDKHTDLHNFEWFQDSDDNWFVKYNATSTNNAVYTYWTDFDETTDSFVDAFQQFDLPNGEASGLVKVRGKYYIWQTGDKLFGADEYNGHFAEIATDIAGDIAHNQFSTIASNNYLYVYYDDNGATYERSSKVTNLIHWSKPVKVVNVGLGSYFYNEKAVSVYPSFEKKDSFNKILKLTANGFRQTVPISCMVPASLQVQWEQNGSYQISFTALDDKSVSYTMLSEEADIEFNGQHFIIKQAVEDASGGIDTKQITATHIYNEISRVRQRKTKTGTLTYSVQDVLSFYLDDKVANPFGFTYAVYGSFDKQQIENLGNSSGSDMLSKITEQWPQAIIYPDNKNIRVYSPESFAKDYGGRIDYLHNSSDVKMTVDSTTITNQVKVFGKQIENTDDNATDNAPVKYYFDPFIVEDKDSIKQYGLHPMDDISDERFTDKNAMQTFAKGQLSPNPAVSIEVTMEDNEVPYAGEKRHLIAKPLNLETDLTVIGYTWYPFDNAQKNSLSFANLPASILKTQANINNRIRMVQLIAQQAINSAKTGTRNYISSNDPMQNDSNDVHTGDIWTLPLIQETQSPMSKSINVQDESTSETNQTIYTDPDNLTKIDVQLSIWNGSKWLEISNQRTTNKLNDKIDNVADKIKDATEGLDDAIKNAQDAIDQAKANGDAITKIKGGSESTIAQLADDINLRVKTDELISQINLKSDNVLIQAGSGKGKLYLDASTVVFSGEAFIPSAAIANIDADKITVSDQFNVNDTFVVDSSGNMIAQNATIAGSIGSNLINSSFENIKQDWKGFMPWWWDDGNISIGNGSIKLDAQAKQSLRTDSELWGDTQWINGELTPSYLKLVSYSQDPALATEVTNLISNNSNDWQQGKVTAQVGMSPKYVNDKNRIVLKENILIAVTSYNQYKVIVSAPYQIIIQEFDSNKKFIRDSGWISGNKDYTTGDKTAFVTVVLSSIKNESITPSDMDNITLQFYDWNDYNQDQNMNGRMYLDATQLSFTTNNGNGHFKVDSTGSLEATGGAYFLGGVKADSLLVNGLLNNKNNEIIDFPTDADGSEQRIQLYKSMLFQNTAERPFIGSANGGYLQFGGDVEFVNFNYGNIGMDTKRYFYVDQANGTRSLLMDSDKATFSGEVSASKLTNRSQESLKRDIQDVDPKNLVRNLYNYKVNSWNYKTESNTVKKHLGGVISDKPNYRVPDVFLDDDGTAINQSNLINALVTTVQEQASQISELYVRLTKLELGETENNE